MNIVKQKWEFLNSLNPLVPKQINKLFLFGLQTLAFRNIQSLRANARISDLSWPTAKMKVYRLTTNPRVTKIFLAIAQILNIVNEKDFVAVDFSDFGNGFQVLMFAKQTRKGRAIPVYFEIIQYPIDKGSQNLFIIKAIRNFSKSFGFKPKLVFDRGFACPSIVKFLGKNQYIFYVRIKKSKAVIEGETQERDLAKNLKENDIVVEAYEQQLRLVISDHNESVKEPWYLITNDFKTPRKKIIRVYYYRFEIEEFFRDAKRLLGLEYINFQKELSLSIVLGFVMLTTWFMGSLEQKMSDLEKQARVKMGLSIFRYCFESLQREIIHLAEGQFMQKSWG